MSLPVIQRELERAIGLAVALGRVGPACREPILHRMLHRFGVLERLPESWADSPLLEPMPWGADRFVHQPSTLPRGFDGPWPQAPVVHREFAPPVFAIPSEERQLHRRYNVSRYLGQVSALSPGAATRALRGPRLVALDDRRFDELINDTAFSQFICPTLDPEDHRVFGPILAANPGPPEVWAKIDASVIDPEDALVGIHMAPTRSLLRFDGVAFRPAAIHFMAPPAATFTPADGPAWALARYFVVQALQYLLVLVFHPRLHFPNDSINAISRTLLPSGHLLAKLLRPHGRFTLGLHDAVIHHRRSVLHNSQRELYTPFPCTTEGIHAGVAWGLRGIPGNSAYSSHRFGPALLDPHSRYGRYRHDWFALIQGFVARVLAQLDPGDMYVRRWADAIGEWLPGFPDSTAIFRDDALSEAVASYICDVSVFHSADHHSYAAVPLSELPWRLRAPPPNIARPHSLELERLVSPEDFFRHQLCHAMFFVPVVIEPLRSARYEFVDARLRSAEAEFGGAMDALDRRCAGSGFPSSKQIAVSLQF